MSTVFPLASDSPLGASDRLAQCTQLIVQDVVRQAGAPEWSLLVAGRRLALAAKYRESALAAAHSFLVSVPQAARTPQQVRALATLVVALSYLEETAPDPTRGFGFGAGGRPER